MTEDTHFTAHATVPATASPQEAIALIHDAATRAALNSAKNARSVRVVVYGTMPDNVLSRLGTDGLVNYRLEGANPTFDINYDFLVF